LPLICWSCVRLPAGDDVGDYMTADELAAAKHKTDMDHWTTTTTTTRSTTTRTTTTVLLPLPSPLLQVQGGHGGENESYDSRNLVLRSAAVLPTRRHQRTA